MGNIGMSEMLLIFLVVLLVFGAKRIPEIARGLGKGIREFKDATNDIKREITVEEERPRIQQPYHGDTTPRDVYQRQETPYQRQETPVTPPPTPEGRPPQAS